MPACALTVHPHARSQIWIHPPCKKEESQRNGDALHYSPGGIGKQNFVTIIEERIGHSDKTGELCEVQRFKQPIVL